MPKLMPSRITTREGAIETMLRWANGEWSHANLYGHLTTGGDPITIATVTTRYHEADTAEVQKWAAVAEALKDAPLDVEWPDDDRTVVIDRDLLEQCLSTIELECGRTETVFRLEAALGKTT